MPLATIYLRFPFLMTQTNVPYPCMPVSPTHKHKHKHTHTHRPRLHLPIGQNARPPPPPPPPPPPHAQVHLNDTRTHTHTPYIFTHSNNMIPTVSIIIVTLTCVACLLATAVRAAGEPGAACARNAECEYGADRPDSFTNTCVNGKCQCGTMLFGHFWGRAGRRGWVWWVWWVRWV